MKLKTGSMAEAVLSYDQKLMKVSWKLQTSLADGESSENVYNFVLMNVVLRIIRHYNYRTIIIACEICLTFNVETAP